MDAGALLCGSAYGVGDMAGDTEMIKYVEISPANVMDEIKANNEVNMLDKQESRIDVVNYLSIEAVLDILANEEERYYFWKINE